MVAAHVALQQVFVLVIGKRYIAALAHCLPPTSVTPYNWCKSTSVFEENDLLILLQRLLDHFDKRLGKLGVLFKLMSPQVYHANHGKLACLIPFVEYDQTVLFLSGVIVTLDRGCGSTKQNLRFPQ